MTSFDLLHRPWSFVRAIDPRRSLTAGIVWLVVALAASFATAAWIWVGDLAGENVVQQHIRRLSLETEQLASDVGQAVNTRLDALRAAGAVLSQTRATSTNGYLATLFSTLVDGYPDMDWLAIADMSGRQIASVSSLNGGSSVGQELWFLEGRRGTWIGMIGRSDRSAAHGQQAVQGSISSLGDMAAPVLDARGRVIGVIAARLHWHQEGEHLQRLNEATDSRQSALAVVLDRSDVVVVGPEQLVGLPWGGKDDVSSSSRGSGVVGESASQVAWSPRFQRMPDGSRVLAVRAPFSVGGSPSLAAWQVQLSEPRARVFQRSYALGIEIAWVSLFLGAITAILGALGAAHLTSRLKRLTRSVAKIGRNDGARIEVPKGRDEVARLGIAFAKILDDLQRERHELRELSSNLERRVADRTREVERLAEESRYTAVVRERLKIARDLHDTLAHSMMAMLSEIRLLRRLQSHDPASMRAELMRAEEVAQQGLNEARDAITQMRFNAVRDTGLSAALAGALRRFGDQTGLGVTYAAEPATDGFVDERAETVFRMVEEALRNIARHAQATKVNVTLRVSDGARLELRIEDDGVGFDENAAHVGHYGLVGLREQAQLIGADLKIESEVNRGTLVRITLPLSPAGW
jgi:signal transduction histidine kinase